MKRVARSTILFVLLTFVFFTFPLIQNIRQLNKSLEKNHISKPVDVPHNDSYEINSKLESLIQDSDLEKRSIFFHVQKQEYIKQYEYEIHLFGNYTEMVRTVKELSMMEGIKIRSAEISLQNTGENKVKTGDLRIQAMFIGV